ncbi:MAG: protein kinase domain-containing protein [Phycisphaerales bacterium]
MPPTPAPIRPTAIELLDEVSRRPAAERSGYLDQRCGGDRALRAEVESLLAHLDAAPGFLRQTPFDGPGFAAAGGVAGAPLPPGTRVLRYTIDRVLGEGGMGVVYLARQEHPDRPVALKLIRPIAATPAMIRRFAREAQMLGRLQHAGIAQIFEAGTADVGGGAAQPFLAMEYVEGVPITEYARARDLDRRARLRLVGTLCEAVEHAHQRGLIHRDLKPANILVTATGEPKILDFGVARAVGGVAPGATMATEVGVLVGTLAYMSPEQVGGAGTDSAGNPLDTRSDIYALGVLMYELLCSRLPHDTAGLELFEAARMVREREPERPGTLDRSLRGDVETIVLTAMAKDRDRRYASAGALREDIGRCLAGEPIAARQDSALYVLRKQLRRYRVAVAAGVLFAALLAGFGVWASGQARAYRLLAGREASAKLRISEQEREAVELLRVSDIERGRMLTLGGDLRGAERALWGAFAARPGADDATWALRELYFRFPLLRTLSAGDGDLFSARFNHDGTLLATAGDQGHVDLWNPATGDLIRTLRGHTQRLNCVRFSPDGTLLGSGGLDSVIRLWNVHDGSPAGALEGHTRSMHEFVFSSDGTLIYSSGQDGTIRMWDVPTRSLLRQQQSRANGWAVRLDPGRAGSPATRVLHTDMAGMVYVRDALTLDLQHQFQAHPGTTYCIAFSPDGEVLASAGSDEQVALWSASDWSLIRRADLKAGGVRGMDFSPDGSMIVATGWRTTVVVDARTLEPAAAGVTLPDFRGGWCAQFIPDARTLVTTSRGPGDARLWAVGPYAGARTVVAHAGTVVGLAVSPDGTRLASSGTDGSYKIWDAASAAELKAWTSRSPVRAMAFSPDGLWLASAHSSGTVRANPLTDVGRRTNDGKGHRGSVEGLAYRPDGRLVSGGTDGTIRLWEAPEGQELASVDAGSAVGGLAVSPDGRWIAANTTDRLAMVWDGATLAPVSAGSERAGSLVRGVIFSPDSARLFMPTSAGPIEVWDPRTGAPLQQFNGHTRIVPAIAFNADGDVLAAAGQDALLSFWDVRSGRCLASLPTGETGVQNLAWLPASSADPTPARLVLACDAGRLVYIGFAPLDDRVRGNARSHADHSGTDPASTERARRLREWLGARAEDSPP